MKLVTVESPILEAGIKALTVALLSLPTLSIGLSVAIELLFLPTMSTDHLIGFLPGWHNSLDGRFLAFDISALRKFV